MKRIICSVALVVLAASALAPKCAADDPLALVMKQEGHTVSLDLKFSKKNRNTLQHAISFLDWGPNGYATGLVADDEPGGVPVRPPVEEGDCVLERVPILLAELQVERDRVPLLLHDERKRVVRRALRRERRGRQHD